MLERISIRNYVIIESQEVNFSTGLNIITGDTGAGKSIILDALTLVLGARAESRVLLDNSRKAVIEVTFINYPKSLDTALSENDCDIGDEIIMRREILPSGKSRAFVNDTPVRLEFMRSISSSLIDLHQQFETLEIQQRDMQYSVLDAYAYITDKVATYRNLYAKYGALSARINRLTEERNRAAKERDYVEYQLNELMEAMPEPGQLQQWEETFSLQENAVEIQGTLLATISALRDDDRAVIDVLNHMASSLSGFGIQGVDEIVERLSSSVAELEDIVSEMSLLESKLDPDPILKAELQEKIDAVSRLLLKHSLRSEQELRELADSFTERLEGWQEVSTDLDKAIAEKDQTLTDLKELGAMLYETRSKFAPVLSEEVSTMLTDLEMKNARFVVDVETTDDINERGSDILNFRFAANKGSSLEPIGKVASGGELSRLSLCIKSVVSKKMQLPSMVFDEIDAGVSGQVALKMGALLKQLSADQQVIMITHSPQIAANACLHLKVEKYDTATHSVARVSELDKEQRIHEVAKMLSGDPPTEAAILNAKELIIQ